MCSDKYKIDYTKGLIETGGSERVARIRRVFERASEGEAITVGFLGGSITQGSLASDDTLCYAYRVYEWFRRSFPKSDITYVNAGIGATDSEFGAARVAEDLLSAKPDFVLMEFSVNDECTEHFKETYEGVIRQILSYRGDVACMLMCNVFYKDGANSERIHRAVARHYGLPMVSMRTTIFDAILSGEFAKEDVTPDDLHPNDDGHEIVADVITAYLEDVLNGRSMAVESRAYTADDISESRLPSPLTLNRYERSVKYDNRNSTSVLKSMRGFIPDTTPRTAVRDCFRNGYSTMENGSFAEYEAEGACIAVQFKRTINLPAPVARVTIDGDKSNEVILDANFDETWGDKLVLTDVYESEIKAKHTVRIEVVDTPAGYNGDFYLAGIVVSG